METKKAVPVGGDDADGRFNRRRRRFSEVVYGVDRKPNRKTDRKTQIATLKGRQNPKPLPEIAALRRRENPKPPPEP